MAKPATGNAEKPTLDPDLTMPFERGGSIQDPDEARSSLFEAMGSDPELAEEFGDPPEEPTHDEDDPDEGEPSEEADESDEDEGAEPESEEDEEDLDDAEEDEELDEELEGEPEDDFHTVTVDGKEERVSLQRLKDSYSATKVSTQRFQQAAELKTAAEAESVAARERQEEYIQGLEQIQELISRAAPQEPDWDQVRAEHPDEYPRLYADWKRNQDQVKALKDSIQSEQEDLRKKYEAEAQKQLESEFNALAEKVPEWSEPSEMDAGIRDLGEFAIRTYGFTPEDLKRVSDHRLLLLIRDAKRNIEADSRATDKVTKAKKRASKTLRPGKRDGKRVNKSKRRRQKALRGDLRETHDPRAAHALIESLLDEED